MADEIDELRREFEASRRELDELGGDLASAEAQLAEFARRDLQVPELRSLLERTQRKHAQLRAREVALRARFERVVGEKAGGERT